MLRAQQKRAAIGIPGGIAAIVVGRIILSARGDGPEILGFFVAICGLLAFWWGCVQLAVAKGYSPWLGAALGLLNFIGIIILGVLPDKHKTMIQQAST